MILILENNTPLAKAVNDEERALLIECYPELAEVIVYNVD